MAQQVDVESEPKPESQKSVSTDLSRKLTRTFSAAKSMASYSDEIEEEDLKMLKNNKFPHLRLLKLIWKDKFFFIVALLSAIIYGLSTPIYAWIFGEWINIFSESDDEEYLLSQTITYAIYLAGLAASILITCTLQVSGYILILKKI